MLDEILAHNARFIQTQRLAPVGHTPRKHTAVVTCMDCRLVRAFEDALGLERGDVVELRTAGATIAQPEREAAANDLIRSLAGAIYLLGVREVIVIGHTDCGLSHVNATALTASMQALGVDPVKVGAGLAPALGSLAPALAEQSGVEALVQWVGAFNDVHLNVKEVVAVIRNSPFLPKIPIHGLVIDINTGRLELVDRGN